MTKQKTGDDLLKSFMKEFFPYGEFKKAGVFTKEMRSDYHAQAKMICDQLGLKSIYEYGSQEIRCHISYAKGYNPTNDFVTVIPNIYES
jgi:hypothetical protein